MTELSATILERFQIRKTKRQKEAFRGFLTEELKKLGYAPRVEGKGSKNVIVGDPETAKVIYTAHYDTCPVLPFPNFITPRSMVWYLLYQLLICLPVFLVGFGAEIGVIVLWEKLFGTDCPMILAIGTLYLVLGFFLWWIYAGPANKHTVNDNTSGVLTLAEIAAALPQELRSSVCLIFFDNEEKGLLGSGAFVKAHKAAKKNALVINFDCVSDGDSIQFYPTKALKKEEETLGRLEAAFPAREDKTTEVVRSFGFYPSDQAKFRRGVGVCALKRHKFFGWYMDRIHTKKDTVLMEENILLLRDGAVDFAAGLAQTEQAIG